MVVRPKILLVEDDEIAAMVAEEMLSHEYWVKHAESGRAALDYLATELPDLVLLDVDMPEMTGYEVCRAMRGNSSVGDLPVIFLSGMFSEHDRLAGYEAGGNDYMTKPVSSDELCAKIRLQLESRAERSRLKKDLASAFSTAMTAMSSTAEIGALLQFMRSSLGCTDYASLCREVLNTLGFYGLEAIVQIRGQHPPVSLGTGGPCSPMEDSVLANASKNGRLFEFASLTSCSHDHITIVVKSESYDDPERHGRMKDNIAMLAEGANARVAALDNEAIAARHSHTFPLLLESTRTALREIEQLHREHGVKSSKIFEELQRNFDHSMLTIGISQSQEMELADMLNDAANQARTLYAEGLEIDMHMENILRQLEGAGK